MQYGNLFQEIHQSTLNNRELPENSSSSIEMGLKVIGEAIMYGNYNFFGN